jgi:O-antigen ligase
MSESIIIRRRRSAVELAGSFAGWSYSFGLAALATFVLASSTYNESIEERATVILMELLVVHGLRFRRVLLTRELGIYACFVGYMLLELFWTDDRALALNTLVPALNFVLILILFSSLAAYHNLQAVLTGTLCGLLGGAVVYTLTQGFPFSIPLDFSYNAIAGMYLFGLIVAVMLSCYTGSRFILLPIQVILLLLVVATTSIKTNLGILLGVTAASVVYFRRFLGVLRRNLIALALLAAALGFVIVSNAKLMEILQRGFSRVSIGLDVLQAREDRPGYTGFQHRTVWQTEGLSGWVQNPLFGYGVESFRSQFGITSHSTPVDLLFNSGLIGFTLFYGLFASIALRLLRVRYADTGAMGTVIFAALVCYLFITLSAIMHYNNFLAAFFALSAQLLAGYAQRARSSSHQE